MSDYDDDELREAPEEETPGETKAEKFSRLAIYRMNKLLSGFESLGKLGNRSSYDYTDEQVAKMFASLRNSLEEAEAKFKPKSKKEESGFRF